MGGDGGTKAVTRAYLRGAGAASTTADHASSRSNAAVVDTALADEEAARSLRTCALTNEPLDLSRPVVACAYGLVYQKEAALEALLKRKEGDATKELRLGDHIRGLKDLHRVRYELNTNGRPVCPVTGRGLGGAKVPAYVLLGAGKSDGGKDDNDAAVNVVSQYAIHQMGEDEIFKEYRATEKLRLAPPADVLAQIKSDLAAKRRTRTRDNADGINGKNNKRKSTKRKTPSANETEPASNEEAAVVTEKEKEASIRL